MRNSKKLDVLFVLKCETALQYRFIFTYDGTIKIITMDEINTRTNINYRRYTK